MYPFESLEAPKLPPFLRLPIELRRQIYHYILPSTKYVDHRSPWVAGEPSNLGSHDAVASMAQAGLASPAMLRRQRVGHDVIWRRGCIAILAVNKQIHDECVDIMYGENTFVLDVSFDSIKFRYKWLLPSQLIPSRTYCFLDHFSQRNLLHIRNYIINVEHVDDYTGMIKYNCGGRGLTAGIRQQVESLVDMLCIVPYLRRLHVHLIEGNRWQQLPSGIRQRAEESRNAMYPRVVLDPFMRIYGVRDARVTGVDVDYTGLLEGQMTSQGR
jgi:hypothetical protein